MRTRLAIRSVRGGVVDLAAVASGPWVSFRRGARTTTPSKVAKPGGVHRGPRRRLARLAIVTALILPVAACSPEPDIRVGVLHSLTGTMAVSERSVADATLLAIEQINDRGGVLGRDVEAIVADGRSETQTFVSETERLLVDEGVVAIFGVWTSAHRKAVLPVLKAHDGLLFYPLQYEGLEQSEQVVYLGATPNQQITPAVQWAQKVLGKRAFLVGSDYLYPHVAHAIIRDELARFGAQVVGERYVALGEQDLGAVVREIERAEPDLIFNTINGDSNLAFFDALRDAGIGSERVPTVSFSLGEVEIASMDPGQLAGDYASWSYFQSIESSANERFVDAFRQRYGPDRVVGDPMESAYDAVRLWAAAVEAAGTTDHRRVRDALANRTLSAPQGRVRIDAENQHLWQMARLGRIRADGQMDIIWESSLALNPEVFPDTRSRADWLALLDELQAGWGGAWASPGSN